MKVNKQEVFLDFWNTLTPEQRKSWVQTFGPPAYIMPAEIKNVDVISPTPVEQMKAGL